MSEIDLGGRVVIVTGAGGGLGRAHALSLAAAGAKVVINDLGDGADDGPSAKAVVEEVAAAGGEAVASVSSVADPDGAAATVRTALDTYGRVDGLVNNAGILRDRSFAKMTEDEFRAVLEVHVLGAYHVTKAAWPHLKEQGFGRIVNTTSPAGLFGNFGQANYATAKAGLVGLTRTLALEGRKAGINVNVVAPLAASRMTETILPPEVLAKLDPALVAPLVTYLCSPACTHTGGVFTAGGGFVARVAVLQGDGVRFGDAISPAAIADRFDEIVAMDRPHEFDGGAAEQGDWVVGQL